MKKNYPNLKLACVALISSVAIFHLNHAAGQLAPNPDFLSGAKSYTYKNDENTSLRLHVFHLFNQPLFFSLVGDGVREGLLTFYLMLNI